MAATDCGQGQSQHWTLAKKSRAIPLATSQSTGQSESFQTLVMRTTKVERRKSLFSLGRKASWKACPIQLVVLWILNFTAPDPNHLDFSHKSKDVSDRKDEFTANQRWQAHRTGCYARYVVCLGFFRISDERVVLSSFEIEEQTWPPM